MMYIQSKWHKYFLSNSVWVMWVFVAVSIWPVLVVSSSSYVLMNICAVVCVCVTESERCDSWCIPPYGINPGMSRTFPCMCGLVQWFSTLPPAFICAWVCVIVCLCVSVALVGPSVPSPLQRSPRFKSTSQTNKLLSRFEDVYRRAFCSAVQLPDFKEVEDMFFP